jgi:hypothetical protein
MNSFAFLSLLLHDEDWTLPSGLTQCDIWCSKRLPHEDGCKCAEMNDGWSVSVAKTVRFTGVVSVFAENDATRRKACLVEPSSRCYTCCSSMLVQIVHQFRRLWLHTLCSCGTSFQYPDSSVFFFGSQGRFVRGLQVVAAFGLKESQIDITLSYWRKDVEVSYVKHIIIIRW